MSTILTTETLVKLNEDKSNNADWLASCLQRAGGLDLGNNPKFGLILAILGWEQVLFQFPVIAVNYALEIANARVAHAAELAENDELGEFVAPPHPIYNKLEKPAKPAANAQEDRHKRYELAESKYIQQCKREYDFKVEVLNSVPKHIMAAEVSGNTIGNLVLFQTFQSLFTQSQPTNRIALETVLKRLTTDTWRKDEEFSEFEARIKESVLAFESVSGETYPKSMQYVSLKHALEQEMKDNPEVNQIVLQYQLTNPTVPEQRFAPLASLIKAHSLNTGSRRTAHAAAIEKSASAAISAKSAKDAAAEAKKKKDAAATATAKKKDGNGRGRSNTAGRDRENRSNDRDYDNRPNNKGRHQSFSNRHNSRSPSPSGSYSDDSNGGGWVQHGGGGGGKPRRDNDRERNNRRDKGDFKAKPKHLCPICDHMVWHPESRCPQKADAEA